MFAHKSLTLYWLMGYFSSRYSSQPQTLRMYLPWYSWTHIFSCSGDSSMLRVFLRMASAITFRTRYMQTAVKIWVAYDWFVVFFIWVNIHPTCSGTQSWLIFNVYFCLSLFGETITQITTIIWPTKRDTEQKKTEKKESINPILLEQQPRNNNHPPVNDSEVWVYCIDLYHSSTSIN